MVEQLSINLTLETTYVSGTVNGAVAEFSLTYPGVWSAVVPKSLDGKYTVQIIAYNNLGTPTNYSTVIYKLEGMIPGKIDWKSEDYYNAEDLNRVEANAQFVKEYLESIDCQVDLGEVNTGRFMEDIDFISSINRVEDNLESIRKAMNIVPPGYGPKKTWTNKMVFNFEDANRYEKNLELLYKWAQQIFQSYKYCGEFICGEEVI